jgi:hypothetical protein
MARNRKFSQIWTHSYGMALNCHTKAHGYGVRTIMPLQPANPVEQPCASMRNILVFSCDFVSCWGLVQLKTPRRLKEGEKIR